MAKSRTAAEPSAETLEHLLIVMQSVAEPVTASQLSKLLAPPHKLSEARLIPILDEFVRTSRLHGFAPKTAKGKSRYWDRDIAEFGRVLMKAALNKKGALSKSDLRKAVKQLTDDTFAAVFQQLVDDQALFEHPPLPKKKATAFGMQPPAPAPYLKDLGLQLTKVVEQLAAARVPREELRGALVQLIEGTGISLGAGAIPDAAPMTRDAGNVDLVTLMKSIEPAADNGALVAARDLRRAANLGKSQFDDAVLGLARQGRLMLHRHDFASGLPVGERDELVTDGAGAYYVGMAIRRE